jgi:phosphoribosylaminoimidazole-succinocarboxamide synthase
MKVLVLFGSASDNKTSAPLVDALGKVFDVESDVISAHRDLEKLQMKLSVWQGDAIIAGAGLAAALPGVVAAMTDIPVFGVPVDAQFGGLDAFGSIVQMPPGVPVMCCAPGRAEDIVTFLREWDVWREKGSARLHFVVPKGCDATTEVAKAEAAAQGKELQVSASDVREDDAFNIYMVAAPEHVNEDDFGLHVPLFDKSAAADPQNLLTMLAWARKGGLWLGANNTRNAVQSLLRLRTGIVKKEALGMETLPMIYEGSVKNVRGTDGASPYIFEYSDRYSIFDWGQMPDLLKDKGESLAFLAWFFFDYLGKPENWKSWQSPAAFKESKTLARLREKGVSHHALGLVGGDLKALSLAREIMAPSRCLAVKPVRVLRPVSHVEGGKVAWDYSMYAERPVNALVPLEVIFRFGVPDGSSLLKRVDDISYCRDIGLAKAPKAGDRFDAPVIEFSTKLENKDRYISYAEARDIAGLSDDELNELRNLTSLIALRMKDIFADIGVELWDGKLEFAFAADRSFMLVDSIGPDELRLMTGGVHLSKETLRGAYRQTSWLAALEKAKDLADQRGEMDWKKICTEELGATPPLLSPVIKERAEMIYKSLSRALSSKFLGQAVFADAWDIDAVVAAFNARKKDAA